MRSREPAVLFWSSGKDSAWALRRLASSETLEVVAVVTTLEIRGADEPSDRVAMHGVPEPLLREQLAALGLPAVVVPLPFPCPNDRYERILGHVLRGFRALGARKVVFGDLHLEDIRAYRERLLEPLDLEAEFPLWGIPTADLARSMIDGGLEARVVCVDPERLPTSFLGRRFDHEMLRELPDGIDPCGENGEFHTLVTGGDPLRRPVEVRIEGTRHRNGFAYVGLVGGSAASIL